MKNIEENQTITQLKIYNNRNYTKNKMTIVNKF